MRKLLPIFILLLIGFLLNKTKLLADNVIDGLKNIIIKVALPAVLFDAFASMTLQVSYLLIFIVMFVFCILLYGIGGILNRYLPNTFRYYYTKGYMTGFEFGMIGVGLFGAIWGIDKLPVIMLVGFGHELFIWFFYVPLISMRENKEFHIAKTLYAFIKTPTIIAIVLGVIVNTLGIYHKIGDTLIGGSIYTTIGFLKPLTSPLILIVIGYSMILKGGRLFEMIRYVITRWVLVLGFGTLIFFMLSHLVPDLDPLFPQAFYAFILLPPPYILPLFIKNQEESSFFTQLLLYSTVLSFVGYIILVGISL